MDRFKVYLHNLPRRSTVVERKIQTSLLGIKPPVHI
jgi:hypothetical protein